MEAVRTSETSVHFNVTTWRYIPEDFILAVLRIWSLTAFKVDGYCDFFGPYWQAFFRRAKVLHKAKKPNEILGLRIYLYNKEHVKNTNVLIHRWCSKSRLGVRRLRNVSEHNRSASAEFPWASLTRRLWYLHIPRLYSLFRRLLLKITSISKLRYTSPPFICISFLEVKYPHGIRNYNLTTLQQNITNRHR
jgi:hypothetical protein